MYQVTREEASSMLNLSTRSIDRYIRSGKLRSKKEGKIVYIHQEDIDNFLGKGPAKIEILNHASTAHIHEPVESVEIAYPRAEEGMLEKIYEDLRSEIKEKDGEIRRLSVQLGAMDEVVKNSISMIEYKKSQFLLEESKISLSSELENTKKELESKTKELSQEKKLNYITIGVSLALFLALIIVWLIKI